MAPASPPATAGQMDSKWAAAAISHDRVCAGMAWPLHMHPCPTSKTTFPEPAVFSILMAVAVHPVKVTLRMVTPPCLRVHTSWCRVSMGSRGELRPAAWA